MSTHEYEPNETVCKRLAHIWRFMLEDPEYDNGASDFPSIMARGLAETTEKNNTPEVLDKFESSLVELLLSKSLKYNEEMEGIYPTELSVDYDPGLTLRQAASLAELEMQFPWKTRSVIFWNTKGFTIAAGYATPYRNHYLLGNGRWLITTLSADDDKDFQRLKAAAVSGQFGFEIQD